MLASTIALNNFNKKRMIAKLFFVFSGVRVMHTYKPKSEQSIEHAHRATLEALNTSGTSGALIIRSIM